MARAKIIEHDGGQFVLLPEEFHFEVDEFNIRVEGDTVVLEAHPKPMKNTRDEIDSLWARIDAIRGDDELPYPEQPRLRDLNFDE